MTARLFVRPAARLRVPMPGAPAGAPRHLPAEGAEVPDTEYWRRRLADGDVLAGSPAAHDTDPVGAEFMPARGAGTRKEKST